MSGCRIHVLKLPNHGGTVPADFYLSIPGLTDGPGTPQSGTTTIDSVQYVQITSFSFSVAGQPGEPAAATGTGAGKVQFSPFSVVLPVDFATPRLFQACATGKEFATATLLVRAVSVRGFAYLGARRTGHAVENREKGVRLAPLRLTASSYPCAVQAARGETCRALRACGPELDDMNAVITVGPLSWRA